MRLVSLCFLVLTGTVAHAQQFTALTDSPLVTTPGDSRSVNLIDVNGDGLDDVFISNGLNTGQNNELYLNQGKGVFKAVEGDPIVLDHSPSDGTTFADSDNDGDLDAYMVTWFGRPNFFYRNEGKGTFAHLPEAVTCSAGTHSETAAFGDYNNDGLADIFITNSGGSDLRNFLYRNTGNNTFVKESASWLDDQTPSRSANWADYDNDGDLDLYVTNEEENKNTLLRNNGNGTFAKVTDDPAVMESQSSITASWGDVNNDGFLDLFVGNTGNFVPDNNRLFMNNGNGSFTAAAPGPINSDGGCSFGSAFEDYDNDGDLDLFVANGFCNGLTVNFLYKNNGAGIFERDNSALDSYITTCSYGAAWGDLNDDGFPDLVVANCKKTPTAPEPNHSVFMNKGNGNHWLKIRLVGTASNRSAIGARILVKAVIDGQPVTQVREITAQSGYCGQNSLTAHFGLGASVQADSVFVKWPSGQEQALGMTAAGQVITIVEKKP
ncbi:MAG TPA: CRTAC1 family protein [Saprospiraceae bacterium]|nr:CRTAC1 family protein [Saprospiraceae bacterium]HPI07903.1 CRTAC1 family protein [Saprospiraceae bacterium]